MFLNIFCFLENIQIVESIDNQAASLIESKAGYSDRKNELLNRATKSWGLHSAIAKLWINSDIEAANKKVIEYANMDVGSNSENTGYWAAPDLLRIYYIFRNESNYQFGKFAALIDEETELAIESYLERFLEGSETGENYENAEVIDFTKGWISENHMAVKTQTYLLASKILGRIDEYNKWKDYWNRLLDYWSKNGFMEIASGCYQIRTLGPILNVYDFVSDPIVKKKAEMILDWHWAEWAQENINGIRGGGKIREYTDYASWGELDSLYESAYVLFGVGRLTGKFNKYTIFSATTEYYPPDVVIDLAVDIVGRYSYEIYQRRLSAYSSPLTSNCRRYVYVTPEYILGGFQSDANKEYEPWGAGFYWEGQKLWEGIIFNTSPDARIFFEELYSPSETFLYKNILIISDFSFDWDDPNKWAPHHDAKAVFPDTVLDEIVEDSGWIFVKEGDVYVAYKPLGGYTLGTLYAGENYIGKTVINNEEESPAILEVGLKSDYNNDFNKFMNDIKDNSLTLINGCLNYTTCKNDSITYFTGPGLAVVNGDTVNWDKYPLVESPYVFSEWQSGYILIGKNERKCTLDFRDSSNPIKIEYFNESVIPEFSTIIPIILVIIVSMLILVIRKRLNGYYTTIAKS
jgi:hypothetical protein